MIKPYEIENSNLSLMLDGLIENIFNFSIIILTIWIFIGLIIWLIRSQN